jgi:hypothetical protein
MHDSYRFVLLISTDKRAAGQEIEDRIMLSPRQLKAAFHGEKQTQTSPEDRPEAAGSLKQVGRSISGINSGCVGRHLQPLLIVSLLDVGLSTGTNCPSKPKCSADLATIAALGVLNCRPQVGEHGESRISTD